MMLIEETTVPDTALPVEDFKAHLRLGTGFGQETTQDEVLQSFLRAAMASVEARIGKVLIIRDFSWTLTFWRDLASQALPVAPVTALSRLAIVDRSGASSEIPAEYYWLQQDAQRPCLRATGVSLPLIPEGGSARIEFQAGFATGWTGVPADLRQAVFLLAAHYYEFRNETSLADGCMPFGVTSLIERYRAMRVGFGGRR